MSVALDATYSLGKNLSGVGVYSRRLMFGLAEAHPEETFHFCYRQHRFLRSFQDKFPRNAHRRLLFGAPSADIFHALNQRVDQRARRTVTTFHDLFAMTGDYSTAEFKSRFAQQAREAAERSDVIVAVSQFTANQVEHLLGVNRARICVIPHGVDGSAPSPTTREKLVLFVGAIQKRKNLARLVRAFERLPSDWKLVLAGAPDGFGAESELAAVERSARRGDIRVAGYVSSSELDSLYSRAAIFAFPSLDEGFGMPVLEAMARGAAVVTSNCSAMPEVAGDAALLVDPRSEDAIADALQRFAGDDTLRSEFVNRGRLRASQFPWSRAVNSTWEVYARLR